MTFYCSIELKGKSALDDVATGPSPMLTRTPTVDVYAPAAQSEIHTSARMDAAALEAACNEITSRRLCFVRESLLILHFFSWL